MPAARHQEEGQVLTAAHEKEAWSLDLQSPQGAGKRGHFQSVPRQDRALSHSHICCLSLSPGCQEKEGWTGGQENGRQGSGRVDEVVAGWLEPERRVPLGDLRLAPERDGSRAEGTDSVGLSEEQSMSVESEAVEKAEPSVGPGGLHPGAVLLSLPV